jgi:sec-independent protein translocase protein TatB
MFDLAWSEIALIAVVALVVIGPKDLPEAIRGVAKGIQKLRRMAGEFQGHVDEMVREAKLDEVRDQINQIRNFDLKGEIERTVDQDGTIRKTFEDDSFRNASSPTATSYGPPASGAAAGGAAGTDSLAGAPAGAVSSSGTMADTFGPPSAAPAEPPAPPPGPPAFIPPDAVRAAEAAKAAAPQPAAAAVPAAAVPPPPPSNPS